jgi:5-hydroxyisourate hydrolase-like protein (transthyretin family)
MQIADSMMNEALPLAFRLNQNYPNPFKEKTRITYCVAYKTRVRLTVVNSAGEVIDTLVDEDKNAGTYEVEFAACGCPSGQDRNLTSGEYSYRLEAADYTSEKKMKLL